MRFFEWAARHAASFATPETPCGRHLTAPEANSTTILLRTNNCKVPQRALASTTPPQRCFILLPVAHCRHPWLTCGTLRSSLPGSDATSIRLQFTANRPEVTCQTPSSAPTTSSSSLSLQEGVNAKKERKFNTEFGRPIRHHRRHQGRRRGHQEDNGHRVADGSLVQADDGTETCRCSCRLRQVWPAHNFCSIDTTSPLPSPSRPAPSTPAPTTSCRPTMMTPPAPSEPSAAHP